MSHRNHPSCLASLRAAVIVGAALTIAPPAAAQEATTAAMPRVRTENPAMAALIQRGTERSATFRGLVATIDGTDGLVFIETGKCGHGVHACLMLSVTVSGPHRLLRVVVDTSGGEREVIASIGHELRHAIEVLSRPGIRSDAAVLRLYHQQEGLPTESGRFETPAAVRAGLDVLKELGTAKR